MGLAKVYFLVQILKIGLSRLLADIAKVELLLRSGGFLLNLKGWHFWYRVKLPVVVAHCRKYPRGSRRRGLFREVLNFHALVQLEIFRLPARAPGAILKGLDAVIEAPALFWSLAEYPIDASARPLTILSTGSGPTPVVLLRLGPALYQVSPESWLLLVECDGFFRFLSTNLGSQMV